jgi:hypothetical protein
LDAGYQAYAVVQRRNRQTKQTDWLNPRHFFDKSLGQNRHLSARIDQIRYRSTAGNLLEVGKFYFQGEGFAVGVVFIQTCQHIDGKVVQGYLDAFGIGKVLFESVFQTDGFAESVRIQGGNLHSYVMYHQNELTY